MFCPNCGKETQQSTPFCPFCGNTLTVQQESVKQSKSVNPRQESMDELEYMHSYFSQIDSAWKRYDSLLKEAARRKGRSTSKAGLVWGIILIAIFSLSLVVVLTSNNKVFPEGPDYYNYITYGFFGFMIALGILLIVLNAVRKANNKKRIAWCEAESDRMEDLIIDHYNKYENCPIGVEYTRLSDIELIYDTIRQGRADTIKEAMNLLI